MRAKKNTDIEFLRFFMTMIIAIFHFSEDYVGKAFIRGGYLGVDFFFILAGFFLVHHYSNDDFKGSPFEKAWRYLFYRVKQLYLPYVVSILLYVATLFFINGRNLKWLITHLWATKWQYLFLHYLGAPVDFEFRSIWYLSPLVLLSYLIYFLIAYKQDLFYGFLLPTSILVYVYIYVNFSSLSMQAMQIGLISGSLVRGFAGMSLGVLAYICATKFKNISLFSSPATAGELRHMPKFSIFIYNAIKALCFLEILGVMYQYGFDTNDFAVLPAMFILIILCKLYPMNLSNTATSIIQYLGSISYWIYLLHLWVSLLLKTFLPGKDFPVVLAIFIFLSILSAVTIQLLIKSITISVEKNKKT